MNGRLKVLQVLGGQTLSMSAAINLHHLITQRGAGMTNALWWIPSEAKPQGVSPAAWQLNALTDGFQRHGGLGSFQLKELE